MTLSGIKTVAKHEFRVRLRTGRWRWLLAGWVGVIAVFTILLRIALGVGSNDSTAPSAPPGIPLFGGLMLFVLALALLVAPALTAQSINGDRERGTLATVQVTRLTATEIATGKLLAAWGTAVVFLLLTLPFVAWAIIEGGVGVGRALVVLAVVALLVGAVCAVAQGLSALLARGITATLMSYLLVFALTVGTLIVFGLAATMTVRPEQYTRLQGPDQPSGSSTSTSTTYSVREPHPEDVWWLLAPNPFVVLADSAPQPPLWRDPETGRLRPVTDLDPLSAIGYVVRQTRVDRRIPNTYDGDSDQLPKGAPVWPYGLGFDVLLGAGAVYLSVRRLRTPIRGLARGVRIA